MCDNLSSPLRSRNLFRGGLIVLILLCGKRSSSAQLSVELRKEPVGKLAADALERGNATRGALLYPRASLACATCHVAGRSDSIGPDLDRLSSERTDAELVESILYPSKRIAKGYESVTVLLEDGKTHNGRLLARTAETVTLREVSEPRRRLTFSTDQIEELIVQKKSLMPDGLADNLANRQEFLDLIRYLIQRRDNAATDPTGPLAERTELDPNLRGLVLLDNLQCASCHENDLVSTAAPASHGPRLTWLAGRVAPNYLAKFLADPSGTKPGTRMPHLLDSLPEDDRKTVALELTHYLLSRSDRRYVPASIDSTAAATGRELFHSVGCVACHSPRDRDGEELLPESSVSLGRLRYSLDGLTDFLEDPLAARPSGHMPNLKLTHFEAGKLANYLLSIAPPSDEPTAFELDPELVKRGAEQFKQRNCNACHAESGPEAITLPPPVTALSEVDLDAGCLSAQSKTTPRYALTAADRESLRKTIDHFRGVEELTEEQQIHVSISKYRCTACHERGTLGGVPDVRTDYFTTTNPNLGPQGRIPPPLTGVGAKLNRKWMRQVLVSGRAIRPYVHTRMPLYGTENIEHLIDLFQDQDHLPPVEFPEMTNRDEQKALRDAGAELVGNGGLNCVACHTFQLKPPNVMPAVDLTVMHERLKPEWISPFLREPKRFHRGTVMPSFWPGGKAVRQDLLDGDTDRQIAAIWEWMKDGRQARTPRGLIRKPMELVVGDEAVMLRRSYPNIGKRGIGVGYPGGVNLAFDVEQMRIALLWSGGFIDPVGVWSGQGHGRVRPLSRNPIPFAPGPEIDDLSTPWTVDETRPPQHRFRGYTLDESRQPTFRYEFGTVTVSDFGTGVSTDLEKRRFRRTLTLTSKTARDGLAFWLRPQAAVRQLGPNRFQIGDQLTIHITGPFKSVLKNEDDGSQIVTPVNLPAGKPVQITVDYEWLNSLGITR